MAVVMRTTPAVRVTGDCGGGGGGQEDFQVREDGATASN